MKKDYRVDINDLAEAARPLIKFLKEQDLVYMAFVTPEKVTLLQHMMSLHLSTHTDDPEAKG